MKKIISYIVLSSLITIVLVCSLFLVKIQKAKAYNRNLLCTDSGLVNSGALNTIGIQAFLASKGGFLKSYSQDGKTAAQIIHGAAVENGINPIAILAMLQKEQSLIYAKDFNQYKVDWAMGYGVCDNCSVNDPKVIAYKGFTKQVNYGAWQLKRNYSYWATNGSVWNVGKTMNIDGTNVTFGNKCTSSQYRYTPHLGTNFSNYFDVWGGNGYYDAQLFYQGPRVGIGSPGVALLPGQTFTAWASFKNTGTATWRNDGATPAHLGVSQPKDHGSPFLGGKNLRGRLVQSTVVPGGIGTFKITMTAPSAEGTYTESFQPVVENAGWLNANVSWTFKVSKGLVATQTKARYLSQGPAKGIGSPNVALAPGDNFTLWVKMVNTGTQTWFRNGHNPVHIGTYSPRDRKTLFNNNQSVRGYLVESSVLPGKVGTFRITLTAPSRRYLPYVEHFRPVMEGVAWFGPDVSWTLKVR